MKRLRILLVPMSASGLCEICTRAEITHTCDRCGRLVCEEHFDEETGLCVECAAEVGKTGVGRDNSQSENPDGVDEFRF